MKRKPSMRVPVKARRVSVIQRLKEQLKLGVKNQKVEKVNKVVPLTEKDIKRIKSELEILNKRVE